MNILWCIIVLILIAGCVQGFKRGLVEGVIRIISWIFGILVLVVLAKGIASFIKGSLFNVTIAITLLVVIRMIYRLIKLLTDSCKMVRKIPIIHWLDKITGIIIGLAESVFYIWVVFAIIGYFDFLNLDGWMLEQVQRSTLLTFLYQTNYLIQFMRMI